MLKYYFQCQNGLKIDFYFMDGLKSMDLYTLKGV